MTDANATAFHSEQFEAIYPPGVERHYWNQCRNAVILQTLRTAKARGPMLEVGCGKGLVVAFLHANGCDIRGVELARVEALPGLEQLVRTGVDALTLPIDERSVVRTILLLDVIEHLQSPGKFITGLRSAFPMLESLVITVPARQELFSNYDEFNGHFRRYDPAMLRAHVEQGGGKLRQAAYFFHSLYPAARLLLRFSNKRKTSFAVPAIGPSSWTHAMLGKLFFLEYNFLPRTWRGSSLIAIADFPKLHP